MTELDDVQGQAREADALQTIGATGKLPAIVSAAPSAAASPSAQDDALPAEFLEKMKAGKRKRRVKGVCTVVAALAVIAAAAALLLASPGGEDAAEGGTGTYVQQVAKGDLEMTVEGSGTLSANAVTNVYVQVDGSVETLAVAQGDTVEEGDVLFTLASDDLQDAVADAKDALDDAYAAYVRAKKSASSSNGSASSGSSGADGSGSSGSASETSSSSSKPSSSKSTSSKKSSSSTESSEPAGSSASSSSGQDTAQAGDADASVSERGLSTDEGAATTGVAAQAASANLSLASYTVGSASAVQTAGSSSDASAAVSQAYSAYKQAKSAYEDAVAELDKLTVTAPASGTVSAVAVSVGDAVSAGDSDAAVVISDLDKMVMTVQVSEYEISNIEKGQKATVTVKAADETVSAKVKSVAMTASSSSSANAGGSSSGSTAYYDVTLVISKPTATMLSGMNATAEIVYESYEDALLVPASAVSTGPQGNSSVTVQMSDGQERHVDVTLLGSTDETAVVEGDLSEGDQVVVTYQISDADASSGSRSRSGGGSAMGGMGAIGGASSGQRGGDRNPNFGSDGMGGGPGGGQPPSGGPGNQG